MNSLVTELPFDYPGKIFASPMPFSTYDFNHQLLDTYHFLEISIIMMLVEETEALGVTGRPLKELYLQEQFQVNHFPIVDLGIPDAGLLRLKIHALLGETQRGKRVVVHCHAGLGRTGTVLACMAKEKFALNGQDAVNWVRQFIPGAVENRYQEQFVAEF